jgi:group II intron reverse transcriptase/maturase
VTRDRMKPMRRQCSASDHLVRVSYHGVFDERNLAQSLRWLRRNGGESPGIDGVRINHIFRSGQSSGWIKDLARRLKSGTYRPMPVVEHRIPKPGRPGEFRPIGIPTVEDRVVSLTISHLLQPSVELTFDDASYGFRLGRGTENCVWQLKATLVSALRSNVETWIIKADIASLFDSMNHARLRRLLGSYIPERRIRELVRKFLRAGRVIKGRPRATKIGAPQGLPLSPLLANLYLNGLDKWYHCRRSCTPGTTTVVPGNRSNLRLFRYVDDLLIVIVGTERDAKAEFSLLENFVYSHLHLLLAEKKTWVRKLGQPFGFLGFHFNPSHSNVQLEVPPHSLKKIVAKVDHVLRRARWLSWNEQRLKSEIFEILNGWHSYFRWTSNLQEAREELSLHLNELIMWHHRKFSISFLPILSDMGETGRLGGQQARVKPEPAATPNPAMPPPGCDAPADSGSAGVHRVDLDGRHSPPDSQGNSYRVEHIWIPTVALDGSGVTDRA